MLFKLLLVTVLNGSMYVDVLDHNLSREDCATSMVELNKVAEHNEMVVCYSSTEDVN